MEYRLLLTFINNRGIVLTRQKLLEDIWDVAGDFVNDNTLTVYIKRLRDKIEEDPANPSVIKTVRGLGYILENENQEFKLMIIISAVCTAVSSAVCLFFSTPATIICFLSGTVITAVFAVFTRQRYKKIEELNDYLSAVCSGNYELDVDDNAEGELSILKIICIRL